jgi:mRNA interferase HigB
MHQISRKKLRQFAEKHPDAEEPLSRWFKLVKRADWNKFADVRADFPQADLVERFIVFNIGGNKYRLIVEINYRTQKVFIRHVLTHKEYDQGDWKS